jgi:hypothetical protein
MRSLTAALGAIIGYGVLTVIAFTLSVALCDGDALETDSGNVFVQIGNFLTFQGCADLPAWFGWLLFVVFTFPWIVFAVYLVLPLAASLLANPVAGTIAAVGFAAVLIGIFVGYVT